MKTYVCDLCDHTIKDPYKVNMREFFVGVAIESYGLLPENSKRRQKIHLCGDCFEILKCIARGEIKIKESEMKENAEIY